MGNNPNPLIHQYSHPISTVKTNFLSTLSQESFSTHYGRCSYDAFSTVRLLTSRVIKGSVVSAIGGGINAIISAIAGVLETIIGAIVAVIVTIFDLIFDILCCRCCRGTRRAGTRGGGFRRRGFTSSSRRTAY
ncbi:hypothetical protein EDB87DRAFT_956024 [Lactarius vividus]|nr:hypothetical protein EDB87DRAFT_956024 [Lactarius vividus]